MIKVVIADDEVKVCQLICSLIDWKSVDMEIVGVAHNGIEALEMIEDLQPDLMITDIRMPGYDGLDMIKQGKQISKDIDFIIISGYSHFEYAQSAVRYGVSDYLLKPIKKDELLDTLNKIRDKYRRRKEQLSNEEKLKIRLQNDIDKLRTGLFTEILFQNGKNSEEIGIKKVNENYLYNFQPGCFQVFIAKMDYSYDELHESSTKILEDKVAQILRSFLKPECFDMEICFQNSRAYCVLNYDDCNKKMMRKQLKASLEEILVQKSVFGNIEFTIGLGALVKDINQIIESCRAAEYAVKQRLIDGTGKLIENIEVHDMDSEFDALLAEITKNMEAAIEVMDSNGVVNAINSHLDRVLNKANISGQGIFRFVMNIFNIYIMLVRNHQLNMEHAEAFYETFLLRGDHCSSAKQLFEYLTRVIKESVQAVIKEKRQDDMKPIRTAKQYIQQNYMNSISLKEVSSVVGFNDTYFSSLFKKESGKNFLEYLSEVRMNKAKELLKETNLGIANICESVGYSDLKHFTKSFKKYTGLSPNEFRKLYS